MSGWLFLLAIAAVPAEALSVATWNIHKGAGWKKLERELAGPLKSSDILLLQEVLTKDEGQQGLKIARLHGAQVVVAGRDVIITRLPLVATGQLLINPTTRRHGAWATLRMGEQQLRVYSLHLSYKVKRSPFIPEVRDGEMARVLAHAKSFSGPVIIGGDLNTVGWFVCCSADEVLLQRLKSAGYQSAVSGAPGRTHHLAGRTDWIFTKGLVAESALRGPYAGSDHRWVRSTLRIPARGAAQQGRAAGTREKVK
jgi:endonuclease/exonuclease/phosphatase (EEP) superfamily protein YafD